MFNEAGWAGLAYQNKRAASLLSDGAAEKAVDVLRSGLNTYSGFAAAVGSSQDAIAAGAIGIITCALSSLWASFCALFSSGGPIGLIGAACIGTIVAMIVYGFLGKGFAIGWKIHNIFWWEWFCGDLN